MESNCPEVLYEIKEETSIFPKLRLDPVNNNYIYLSSANKVSTLLNKIINSSFVSATALRISATL